MPIIESVKKPIGQRFFDSLPHLGAVGASLVVYLVLFVIFVPLAIQNDGVGPVGLLVYLVLLASPIVGAVVVLRAQGRSGGLRSDFVRPYLRGFVVGVAAMLILALEGVFPFFNENGVGVAITTGAFLTLLVVPFLLPAIRFLMWLLSPPAELEASQTSA
jgi:hypothetical protein